MFSTQQRRRSFLSLTVIHSPDAGPEAQRREMVELLLAHGADPTTPAAIIDKGTRDQQQVITGALDRLTVLAAEAKLGGPATIIIGTVVTLRDNLSWFKPRNSG